MLTRPSGLDDLLAEQLRSLGCEAFQWPLLKICPIDPSIPASLSQDVVHQKINYIFVSAHAVQYCPKALLKSAVLAENPVYAVGGATAQRLEALGVPSVQVPLDGRVGARPLLELEGLQEISGSIFVIIRGVQGSDLLFETLSARGAEVWECRCYLQKPPGCIPEALLSERFDAILMTSYLSLQGLYQLCQQDARGAVFWNQLKSSLWFIPPLNRGAIKNFLEDQGCSSIQILSDARFQSLSHSFPHSLEFGAKELVRHISKKLLKADSG